MPPRVTVSTDQIRTKGSGQIRKQYLISALKILSNWFFLFQNPKKTSELAQRDNFIENLKDFNPLRLFHIRPFGRKKKEFTKSCEIGFLRHHSIGKTLEFYFVAHIFISIEKSNAHALLISLSKTLFDSSKTPVFYFLL